MAKLTRVLQKIFASGAGGGEIGVFGSLAAGAATTTTDPAQVQSLANFIEGWFAAIVASNSPAIEDMNGLFFLLSRQLAYIFQAGVPEYDATTSYYIGSIVNVAGDLYVSIVDDNLGNAVTDNTKWKISGTDIISQSGSYTILRTDKMIEFTGMSADVTATLPAVATTKGQRFTVTKMDATDNMVTVTDGTFSQQLVGQYDSVTVFSNGTVYYAI